jgi:hypothetical protein
MQLTAKELGNAGEALALKLLIAKGYAASILLGNYPTYDIKASRAGMDFFVSVKVSRNKQHVRLGTRASVLRLTEKNFVFAFLPIPGQQISLADGGYRLWIIPAHIANADSLGVHDAYWAERGGDKYSVMVKGYGRHHVEIWKRWSAYDQAWHLLP